MVNPSPASFWTQANALLRKNLTYQRKHIWTNVRLILVPLFLCLILLAIQQVLDALMKSVSDMSNCGGNVTLPGGICPIPNPPPLPPMLQIPQHELRSVKTDFFSYKDLPDKSCRGTGSCPVTILITGDKLALGKALSANIFSTSFVVNSSDLLPTLANNVLGSTEAAGEDNYEDPGIASDLPIYSIQPSCSANSTWPLSLGQIQTAVKCVQGLCLWRNNSVEVNDELFKGSWRGNPAGMTNEIVAAYDLMSTDRKNFNVTIWYNSTYNDEFSTGQPLKLVRVPRSINLISNAYLKFLKGLGTRILFEFLKEVPKKETKMNQDIASLLGPLFFTWVVLLLFPDSSTSGSMTTASIVAYILVYGTGLLGSFLFQKMIENQSFPEEWILAMELYPGFSLYRGLYEFSQYASRGNGMKWQDLSDSGMGEVFCIMSIEWFLALIVAYYIDQVFTSGKHPFFFLVNPFKKPSSLPRRPTVQRVDSKKVSIDIEKLDITEEVEMVTRQKWQYEGCISAFLQENASACLDLMVPAKLPSSVCLFDGGVGDKPAGNYSGGMKRRLSVAISLIGNPKVVYLDEPSTGLDPASRKNLWNVIKRAKQNTAIILTTHSMEEAEFLCDRLGIFVDGGLQCIGNSKELKSRYGGSYVFTMTTSSNHEEEVERLVESISPNAKKIYHLAGTQKFELPKQEVRIAEVFRAVEKAKSSFTVFAWGLADTTLEDVFIKVARTAQAFISLS
ncbi:unnamed protein product [Arabidopsis lyrata]|nr:unnamed protein product [Arabidopsis lyrata]